MHKKDNARWISSKNVISKYSDPDLEGKKYYDYLIQSLKFDQIFLILKNLTFQQFDIYFVLVDYSHNQ